MKIIISTLALLLISVLSASSPVFAAAWLQKENAVEMHLESATSKANGSLDSITIPYERKFKQIYVEYGLTDSTTLVGKYYRSILGSGFGSERDRTQGTEIGLRKNLEWKKGNLIPLGTSGLFRYLSPDNEISRDKRASYDIGFSHYSYNKQDSAGVYLQISRADKIRTHHKNPLSLQTEFISLLSRTDDGNGEFKLTSRLQLGYRDWYIGYERLDGEIHRQTSYYQSLWLWEIGVPYRHHLLRLKWGHDRTQKNIPRETFVKIALEINFEL